MTVQRACPRCSRPLVAAARPHDLTSIQRFVFCPKCHFEALGEIVPGHMEIESEWFLSVSTCSTPSLEGLRALRAVPSLSAMPLTVLASRMREEAALKIGPFSRSTAVDFCHKLRAAGLTVDIE